MKDKSFKVIVLLPFAAIRRAAIPLRGNGRNSRKSFVRKSFKVIVLLQFQKNFERKSFKVVNSVRKV